MKMRILIVEDSTYKLRTVEDILKRKKDTQYDVANCAYDAFKLFQDNQYDLTILDLGFCNFSNDVCQSTYKARQGLILLETMKIESRRHKKIIPSVIIYSETEITEKEKEGIFGKADNEFELKDLLDKWYEDSQVKTTKILIVEDNETKLETICQELTKFENVEYIDAKCAMQAKLVCEKNHDIDIMILDMSFPWKFGEEAEIKSAVRLITELEKHYWEYQKPMPYIIAYSIIPFEDTMIKYGREVPKTFYAQTFFTGGLKEVLTELLTSREEG